MFGRLLPATRTILLLTFGVFAAQWFTPNLVRGWELWPLGGGFHWWQLITYALLHGGVAHIVFNMIGLWSFGNAVESYWGEQRLYIVYLVSVVSAALTQLATGYLTGLEAPTVGASGGVFGLLLAFAVLFPQQRVFLMLIPVPVPARVFAIGYAALELYQGVTNTASGVAHFAHLGGMLGAGILIWLWRREGVNTR
jgi:membrane associated rhomboid family serine protease